MITWRAAIEQGNFYLGMRRRHEAAASCSACITAFGLAALSCGAAADSARYGWREAMARIGDDEGRWWDIGPYAAGPYVPLISPGPYGRFGGARPSDG